ncbi:ATP-binding protein [Agrobacterium rosae]|uniref:Clamp loader, small subunit n=1 Tax=Agrobacterium rosae TaxID=1972867 RepID=A0A1R3U4Z5_9HYPH|nr:ATP-binding protein [Agrobacterium rosae]SCX36016.1 clamp loader, small subunit [Agrobacterium rosae]
MSLERIYSPKTKLYYQWLNADLKPKLQFHLDGSSVRPLLLFGPPGSGKSKVASLLPHMICPKLDPEMNLHRTSGLGLNAKGVEWINEFSKRSAWNEKRMNVIVIDEVDDAHISAMNGFKGFLDEVNQREDPVLVIMTTNHAQKISKPVLSRCEAVYVGPPAPTDLLPFAMDIMEKEGFPMDATKLLPILQFKAQDGLEYREMYKRLERLLAKIRAEQSVG